MNENYINRGNPNYKTEAHYLRAFVNHYSFVTGLIGKLEGRSGNPEDCSIGVNVILDAYIYEGCRVSNPEMFHPMPLAPYHNVLEGGLFQCCDLLNWIAGTYFSKYLKENKINGPTEFTIEKWICEENHLWTLKSKTHWGGVEWLDAAHTGDGGDRTCAGIATFVCNSKIIENIDNGRQIKLEATKYSRAELRRKLQQELAEPKHPESYLG